LQEKNIEKRDLHLLSRDGVDGANGHEGGEEEDESGDFAVHDDVSEGDYLALNSEKTAVSLPGKMN
jgi:hypothetical protein